MKSFRQFFEKVKPSISQIAVQAGKELQYSTSKVRPGMDEISAGGGYGAGGYGPGKGDAIARNLSANHYYDDDKLLQGDADNLDKKSKKKSKRTK